MEQQLFFDNRFGRRLCGILSRPTRGEKIPVVVACHGFGSGKNTEITRTLTQHLDGQGIASLRFDFTGHADSEGDIGSLTVSRGVDDLRAAIHSLAAYPWIDQAAVGLFGHSFGGNVVLWYAAGTDSVQALALLS